MSYAGLLSHRNSLRGRGVFAAAGLGRVHGRGIFAGDGLGRGIFDAVGLGQTKTATTTATATAPDRTASDWASALTTGGTVVSSIVGAATGAPTATPTVAEEIVDPATTTAPAASATPMWYWPVVIGVGVAVLGGIAYMSYQVKGPVRSNRRSRRLRRNYAYGHVSHPGSYDSRGRPRRNSRRRSRRR